MGLSNNFSSNLSSLRKLHKVTLTEFANESQISRSHLQNALKGSCNPTLDTVEQIAKGLQVDPLMLLSGPDAATPEGSSPLLLQNIHAIKIHLHAVLRILEEMFPEEPEPPEEV